MDPTFASPSLPTDSAISPVDLHGIDMGRSDVTAQDQAEFEIAMNSLDGEWNEINADVSRFSEVSFQFKPEKIPSIGDSILEGFSTLKRTGNEFQAELVQALSKPELSSSDLLKIQFDLVHMNLELQTTTNMAHHGVEDIKTIMRGQ
ncbi:EscI/YscI/HrpB family type III secretion system inner rod protein [Roseiconus lacunae]|uniref:EscI/YscI/HrpB family type III secretion system inner rod protein n=1 Tax=Roseiconus lacunae TaxID=2605694 RepID=UPI001E4C4403|nr:EscI/YscI/HrpB family type III secretion system inner rod protein [Roseiconus lacunae]MCD0457877.1 EscI/YscI/HrpB family type III secretion system inner rod protein [Roseiconus lacunae]